MNLELLQEMPLLFSLIINQHYQLLLALQELDFSRKKLKDFKLLISFFYLFSCGYGFSQTSKTIVGISYAPIIPNKLVGHYQENFDKPPIFKSSMNQKIGYSFGLKIRHDINKLSFETGIKFFNRNYDLNYHQTDKNITSSNQVSIINYHIPISGLVFIQLSDQLFMNVTTGINFEFYPSNVFTSNQINFNQTFKFKGAKNNWILPGAHFNLGWEYRTSKIGYFYCGFSYQQSFLNIMNISMSWNENNQKIESTKGIKGSFLTFEMIYYFRKNR